MPNHEETVQDAEGQGRYCEEIHGGDSFAQPQQANLAPTPFPQSLVNIVNPPAAPDPTGLAAALNVLGTPNIFRDMSGRAEVEDLLKKLSDNSVSMAEASNMAKAIQAKYGNSLSTSRGGFGSAGGGLGSSAKPQVGQSGAGVPGTLHDFGQSLQRGVDNGMDTVEGAAQKYQYAADQASRSLFQNVSYSDGSTAGELAGIDPLTNPDLITGSLELTVGGSPPSGERLCFPVSAFQIPNFASGIGTIAERFIEEDYCDTLGCPPSNTYFDKNNPTDYKNFLIAHNPLVATGPARAKLDAEFPEVKRPDIMFDDGVTREYYEIKPLSPAGAAAGLIKLVRISKFMGRIPLPYIAGTTYTPSKDILIMSGSVLGCNVAVSFNVQRYVPGGITYSLCLQGELVKLLGVVAMATLMAWIAAQLLSKAAIFA